MAKETSFERELAKYAWQTASRVIGVDYAHKAWERNSNWAKVARAAV